MSSSMSSSTSILSFQIGDRVLIEGPSSADGNNENFERAGTVKFIGKTEFKEGDWLGVELDKPTGKNDGSVAGVRYFTCEPFHGLFVPPNKARLNLSGDSKFGEGMFSSRRLSNVNDYDNISTFNTKSLNNTPVKIGAFGPIGTPNHLDRIENLQMDFSAIKDISDSFPVGLKTPTANVKSQNTTPATSELKTTQNDIFRLRDQIMSIKADLKNETSSDSSEAVNSIVNKLSGMLESYEQVSSQYENQLKQFLMARKASKLDTSNSNEVNESLLNNLSSLQKEYENVRNDLYNEIKENDHLKKKFEDEFERMNAKLGRAEEELKRSRFEIGKSRTEHEIELVIEEEHRKRAIEHENELEIVKRRHEEEMKQKKLLISDLQNEVLFLRQTEKVLEEELKSRKQRWETTPMSDDGTSNTSASNTRKLEDDLFSANRQVEEFKRLWEDSQSAKKRSEEHFRAEIERLKRDSLESHEFDELKGDLKELGERLKQTRNDNEELTWALDASRKETEKLNHLIEEQAQKLSERERKLQAFSERIKELESREIQSKETVNLEIEIKRLNLQLGEERSKAAGPIEQISALKRKISLIEREKELLEEQLRSARLSAFSQGEFQTFSTFIQGLKRHIEAEILSIEPLKLTLQDVVRAKEMVDILLKVTEDVRVKVLNHLSQVEEVIKSRFSTNNTVGGSTEVETVKVDRVRNYDSNSLTDLRRRIDFRSEMASDSRTLKEPLGIAGYTVGSTATGNNTGYTLGSTVGSTGYTGTNNNGSNAFARSSSSDNYELENRMNNFRNLVSDLRSRQPQQVSNFNTRPSQPQQQSHQSYSHYNQYNPSQLIRAHEPVRCNLCQEYGHDALSCPDYLSGAESFSEDAFLKDVRNSKFNSRFSEKTRV